MSNCTTRIKLPYIIQSQSQKEVTHNASLEIIDTLLHPMAIDIGINTPPESAKNQDSKTQDGNRYIVGSTPRGAWENYPNSLAYSENGSWKFIEPFEGLMVWVRDKKQHYIYDGLRWFSIFEVIENERKKREPQSTTDSEPKKESEKTK